MDNPMIVIVKIVTLDPTVKVGKYFFSFIYLILKKTLFLRM